MLQPKDIDWLKRFKNKTYIYAIYKKPTSDLKTHIDWKWEDGKTYSMQMGKNKAGVAILIIDKIDLKIKVTRDKEGHYIRIKESIQEEDITIVTIIMRNAGLKKHKLESRLPGDISITSDMQMTPPLWQKVKRN